MTLKKVLIIKVFFFVNKLYPWNISSCSAKIPELLRIQPLIVLVPEVPVALEQFHLVKIGVFYLAHQAAHYFFKFARDLKLQSWQELVHFESSIFSFLLEGGGRIEPCQQICDFLFLKIMFAAMTMTVNTFNTVDTGTALTLGAVLENTEEFGSACVFAHLYYGL